MDTQSVFRTSLRGLEKLHEGKVRDIYAAGADALLIVTTDRLSAFDVVLPDPIPGKGRVLNEISNFWFARTRHIVPNHLTGRTVFGTDVALRDMLKAVVLRPPAFGTSRAIAPPGASASARRRSLATGSTRCSSTCHSVTAW